MTMFQKICVSVLFAIVIEALCILMMMSGGVLFGAFAYVGIALLWPASFVSNLLFSSSEIGFLCCDYFLAFVQFFVLSFWLVSTLCRRRVA
jgi:hypothetical protein